MDHATASLRCFWDSTDSVEETSSEVIVTVETTADFVGCPSCGVRRWPTIGFGSTFGICPVLGAQHDAGLVETPLLCRRS